MENNLDFNRIHRFRYDDLKILLDVNSGSVHVIDQPTWDFFDYLLEKANVVGTPGVGFGPHGEGYFRLTAFGTYENTVRAIERMKAL